MGQHIPFIERLKLAWRVLMDAEFASKIKEGAKPLSPERLHASGLMLLNALQREGRLIDFLQQDVTGFSDEEVGAAARVVHGGCRKVIEQFFEFEPAVKGDEGISMSVPAGFDPQRIRLTGNVTGQPPFKGTLKHHGWVATTVRVPAPSEALDPRVIAPAEVELL
ncbi:MAG: DUF2760 domain-containing protein [Acidobacteria bacterium]|nr:MAG: DUF2760 domain-containing protein [Acidobacteriota bacterium]